MVVVGFIQKRNVDTPKIRAVSLIIKFTEYTMKKIHPEVQDQTKKITFILLQTLQKSKAYFRKWTYMWSY
ncbi:MAG: hypothetical protein CMH44_09515 [Muricauda sp.]|nr:hypothetical protein [Allomuricauda sp.]